jgi:anti-sigma regulatory factor (Ser/Thr protein kinase)
MITTTRQTKESAGTTFRHRALLTRCGSRTWRRWAATPPGLDERGIDDLLIGVNELACNSIRHGGGEGRVRVCRAGSALICEVRDRGTMNVPLAGRVRPDPSQRYGRGLWMTNQLCDLVQLRCNGDSTVARVHMRCSAVAG